MHKHSGGFEAADECCKRAILKDLHLSLFNSFSPQACNCSDSTVEAVVLTVVLLMKDITGTSSVILLYLL